MKGIIVVFFRNGQDLIRNHLTWLFILLPTLILAQSPFSGSVVDESGEPLPWTTISVDNGKYGTISEADGSFLIVLQEGNHSIKASRVGYATQEINISVPATSVQIVLKEAALTLDEILIMPGEDDPAIAIMREAIKRKKANRRIAEQYAYQAYTKSVFKFADGFSLDSLISSVPGSEAMDQTQLEEIPFYKTNILYLSETLSKVWKGKGNKEREAILSSNTSGTDSDLSIFGQLFNQFDPYVNRAFTGEMAERGIVSPLADQALLIYDVKLLGLLVEGEQTIYKIAVSPKRKSDAAFYGVVQIADESFAVQSLDLWCTNAQAVQVVDSIHVTQGYLFTNGKWAPLTTKVHLGISFDVLLFKLPIWGTLTSVMSDYEIDPILDKNFFNNEVIAISDTALIQSDSWWEIQRPVPLTALEELDYSIKDSLAEIQNSPEFLDSLTKEQPGPRIGSLYFGYTWTNFRNGSEFRWGGLWSSGFNAIEGWFIDTDFGYTNQLTDRISLGGTITGRGSFSAKRLHYIGEIFLKTGGEMPGGLSVSAGDYPRQFSGFSQITPFANTYASLIHHRSHIRLYRQKFLQTKANWNPHPGLTITGSALVERRSSLENTSEYSIRFQERQYEENFSIDDQEAVITGLSITYQPGVRYISLPDRKIAMGSNWPEFGASIAHAIPTSALSPDYTKLSLSISHTQSLGAIGTFSYTLRAGRFLRQNTADFPDLFHFAGGETFFRKNDDYNVFFLMPYYSYSSDQPYLELHAEQAFGMLGIAKIPGIRKLKISEFAGIHGLVMENRSPYLEISYGIEARIFKVFKLRMDMHVFLLGEERWLPYAFTYRPQSLVGL